MKGSGVGNPSADVQNYVFTGKPNNSNILTDIGANSEAVVGNPYPSAIDIREFIKDNIPGGDGDPNRTSGSISGDIYLWEHYISNTTHITEDYEGGYAIINLSGNLDTYVPGIISGVANATKIPEYYLPVGQGFFVDGAGSGQHGG